MEIEELVEKEEDEMVVVVEEAAAVLVFLPAGSPRSPVSSTVPNTNKSTTVLY